MTSTNGTYLGEDKLAPLQLYELTTESVLKFGLVSATYFKVIILIVHVEVVKFDPIFNHLVNKYSS